MKKLSYLLKSSQFLYSLYFYVMSGILKLIGLFIRTDDKLILFNSYGGKKYDDSPRAIYEQMLKDDRFIDCRFMWAIQEPDKIKVTGRADVVRADSFRYFVAALRARVWVTNSSMERGLDFKKKNTVCFNSWHGSAIKVMGIDIKDENQSFKSKVLVRADIMLAQSQYDIDTFSHAFQLPVNNFRMTGLPRNDILTNHTKNDVERIKEKLGIDKNKVVLLYAPTFREYTKGTSNEVVLRVPMNLQHWQNVLGDEYIVLFRAHYEVAKHMKIDGYSMFLDMSSYPDLNELMIISDALISDYSSIYFDFSVTHKPMYCFAYDYEEYMANRGMYLSLKDELPCGIHQDENGLIEELLQFRKTKEEMQKRTAEFQKKYVTECGHGAEKSCEIIAGILRH